MEIPEIIDCVDCGQKAHRLSDPPEDGWEIGDVVAYRCSGCNDRWDLVIEQPGQSADERELTELFQRIRSDSNRDRKA